MTTPDAARTALVVDDEPHIVRAVRNALAADFARVLDAGTAQEGVDLAAAQQPDVLILDLGLPEVRLLDAGADDYVTKPFSIKEFQARVRAQVRRATIAEGREDGAVVRIGDLVINLAARTVRRDDSDVHLTPSEWELLRAFLRHRGKTLTHRRLFREVWVTSAGDPQQYLRVYVAHLRRKLSTSWATLCGR